MGGGRARVQGSRIGRGEIREAAREAAPWVERFARCGYVAKGVIYIVIGILAAQAAMGPGGKTTDGEGALRTVLQMPMGRILLGIVAVGLIGYALWRLVEAVLDVEDQGADAKGILKRVGYAASGAVYGVLAFTALQMLLGRGSSEDHGTQQWVARFLNAPFGRWLIAAAGIVALGLAGNALYIAYSAAFTKKLNCARLGPVGEAWAIRIGRFGLAARGVVFGVIGWFLLRAALQADPDEARGSAGALKVLAQQPMGVWVLTLVAVGLVAYGLHMFVEARCRRIDLT